MTKSAKVVDIQHVPAKAKKATTLLPSWEHISPRYAALLINNTVSSGTAQRSTTPSTVKKYADEMVAGTWHKDLGDAIQLALVDGNEVVPNGLHRLHAIADSGVGLDSWVFRYVDSGSFKYFDGGLTRTLSQLMAGDKWAGSNHLAPTALKYWNLDKGGNPFSKVQKVQAGTLMDYTAEHHPELKDMYLSYETLLKTASKKSNLNMPVTGIYFLFLEFYKQDSNLAIDVLNYLANNGRVIPPADNFAFAVTRIREIAQIVEDTDGAFRADHKKSQQMQSLLFAWNETRLGVFRKTLKGFKSALTTARKDWSWEVL
jgi:hypothetical protein